MKLTYKIIIIAILTLILIYTIYFFITYYLNYNKYMTKLELIDENQLKKGDILLHNTKFFSYFQPGFYSHVGVFGGYDKNNIPFVYESYILQGTRKISLKEFLDFETTVVRVNLDENKTKALLNWFENNLNLPFEYYALSKTKNAKRFYCSEYVWVGFLNIGIDLDSDSYFDFTVTPQEIYDSNYLEVIGLLKLN